MTKKKIGLIGAGLMGHGIGKNIVTKGYELIVLAHRNRTPIDDLLSKGAKEGKTARAVAEASDVVFLCVTGSPQVEDLVFRKDGLLDGDADPVSSLPTARPPSRLQPSRWRRPSTRRRDISSTHRWCARPRRRRKASSR